MSQLRCITLHQPWASWIAMGWKTIETRGHARFACLVGEHIGIHAGRKWDRNALLVAGEYLTLEQQHITNELRTIQGAIVCTAFVRDHIRLNKEHSKQALIACHKNMHGLLLEDIETPTYWPHAVQGQQGIWTITTP